MTRKFAILAALLSLVAVGTMANKCDVDVNQVPDTSVQ